MENKWVGNDLAICLLIASIFTSTALAAQTDGNRSVEPGNTKDECKHPEIRDELLERMKKDQEFRHAMMESHFKQKLTESERTELQRVISKLHNVDRENREWLKPLIQKHGWLGKTLVGKKGANAAWLLVQHSDDDPGFQKECLALMEKMKKGEVTPVNLGYLTDRVLAAEGKPQRYGTQVEFVDGKPRPKNVEDPKNLDKRRREIGLGPIADYLERFKQ